METREERVKLVFAVEVALAENPGGVLKPGMPADAVVRWQPDAPWVTPGEASRGGIWRGPRATGELTAAGVGALADRGRHRSRAAAVIEVRGLRRAYGRGRIQAVRTSRSRVARGEVFGLIGPDGAGKTSVLQMLAGVLRADAGTARVAGVDVIGIPSR